MNLIDAKTAYQLDQLVKNDPDLAKVKVVGFISYWAMRIEQLRESSYSRESLDSNAIAEPTAQRYANIADYAVRCLAERVELDCAIVSQRQFQHIAVACGYVPDDIKSMMTGVAA